MAYPVHALLTMGGALGPDQWSIGVRMYGPAFADASESDQTMHCIGVLDALRAPATTMVSGWSLMNGLAELNWMKLNAIGPDGRYVSSNTVSFVFPSATRIAGGGPACPPQTAIAVSLRTGRDRGIGSKGRVFLPNGIAQVDEFAQITTAQANEIATRFGRFLNAASGVVPAGGDAGMPLYPAVVSRGKKIGGDWGPGSHETITAVRVGRVIDTQQRRRRSANEAYVVQKLAALA